MAEPSFHVGGQAVIEGVMMRAPSALAVAVRRADGEVVLKAGPWKSLASRLGWLRWPFIRGSVVLIEALVNGVQALAFSANQALEDESEEELGPWALGLTVAGAVGFALLVFVVLPHYLSLLLGSRGPFRFGLSSVAFHAVDGGLKLGFFLIYLWLISRIEYIGRVFEYHGAEHKSIYAFEAGRELTVENARDFSILHPRCGTAFLLVVLMVSLLFFSVVFPLLTPAVPEGAWGRHLLFVGVKILLLGPIAGVAYELNRHASRHLDRPWLKAAVAPGLWVQRLTTREPSEDQIDVALTALKKALAVEAAGGGS